MIPKKTKIVKNPEKRIHCRPADLRRVQVPSEDIVIGSGCSGALEMAITVLCSPGDAIAIPRPGFSLYRTIAESRGISVYPYDLLSDAEWQVDLEAFHPPPNCRAWIINNPSNPCGSVFSREHLEAIVCKAEELHLPLITDEIYEDMVFGENPYIPIASVAGRVDSVPVLTCSGIGKRFLVPGWRLGWIALNCTNNRCDAFVEKIRNGLADLATLILGANAIVQAALPRILAETPTFFARVNAQLGASAAEAMRGLAPLARFLRPVAPCGAMYMMVTIIIDYTIIMCVGRNASRCARPFGADDVAFCEALLAEELVSMLPGSIFGMPGYVRLVFVANAGLVASAMRRLHSFVQRHSLSQ